MAWYEWWNEASKRKEEEEKSGVEMLAWQEGVGGGWERESQKCQRIGKMNLICGGRGRCE